MYDEDGNWIDLGGGSGGGNVDIISAPPEYDASGGGSIAPLSPEDEAQYQKDLASADAQAQLQAPNIQKISEQITNFQDILPADLTSQIQSMSQQLLQQQSVIQQDVQTTLAQQTTVNQAATAYQEIYASASPQVTAATSDYNSSLAGYNQAYAQYAKSHNPNYLGSVLGQLQRDIPNVSAGWFLNKMNADKATITNLNNQITAASTAYDNDLAAYKATAANLQASVSVYNANYTNYTGAVATANGDVKAAQDAAAAKVKADQQAAADKAAADKAAAEAQAAKDAAAAAARVKPAVTLYSLTPKLTLSAYDTAYLQRYVRSLKNGASVTCVGYIYKKGTTLAKATALAKSQATAICALMKKTNKTLKTSISVVDSSKAPKGAVGSKWVAVSYLIDGFKTRG